MPKLSPISWSAFVRKMKALGFGGPFQEGKHPYMVKGNLSITIPNPHKEGVNVDLLIRILRQAMVSRQDWLKK